MRAAGVFAAAVFFWVALSALRDDARFAQLQAAQAGEQVAVVQGKDARWWSRRAVQARKDANKRGRTIRRLKTAIRRDWSVSTAIKLAAITYAVSEETLWRKALCETGGTLSPYAKNRSSSAAGLFQFLDSTWASTPYGGLSVYDPYANALAAGWMHNHGRGGEWVCQ